LPLQCFRADSGKRLNPIEEIIYFTLSRTAGDTLHSFIILVALARFFFRFFAEQFVIVHVVQQGSQRYYFAIAPPSASQNRVAYPQTLSIWSMPWPYPPGMISSTSRRILLCMIYTLICREIQSRQNRRHHG
jgi:hypothetical protein